MTGSFFLCACTATGLDQYLMKILAPTVIILLLLVVAIMTTAFIKRLVLNGYYGPFLESLVMLIIT